MDEHHAFVGIGANLGNPAQQCLQALDYLKALPRTRVIRTAPFYKTEPLVAKTPSPQPRAFASPAGSPLKGEGGIPWYVNTVCELQTNFTPRELLNALLSIEQEMGRTRREKWASRVIDLDLLFFDDLIVHEENLVLPHPEIQNRSFVLEPMCEIAPEWKHPVFKKPIRALMEDLKKPLRIEKVYITSP